MPSTNLPAAGVSWALTKLQSGLSVILGDEAGAAACAVPAVPALPAVPASGLSVILGDEAGAAACAVPAVPALPALPAHHQTVYRCYHHLNELLLPLSCCCRWG